MKKAFVGLIAATLFMFAFPSCWCLYTMFCEVTGLNGKIYGPSNFLNPKKKLEKETLIFAF